MDYACPHCHELMRTDPASGQPPPMCPRCGGDTSMDPALADAPEQPAPASPASLTGTAAAAPAARSLATFLQSRPPVPDAKGGQAAHAGEGSREEAAPAPGLQTLEQRLDSEEVAGATEGADATARPFATDPDAPAVAGLDRHGESGRDLSGDSRQPTADRSVTSTADRALAASVDVPAASASAAPASAPTHDVSATPSFTQPTRDSAVSPHIARWQWAALATLALALVLQVLLADRERLAADAQWRPLIASLCGVFGCSLPAWHEPDAFTMLSRDVRPVPGSTGALLVQATFRNDARWSQAWPVLRLALSDADGRTVGARAFAPSEYLDAATTQTALAPGQSAQIVLQVREPETSVVAFSFEFD